MGEVVNLRRARKAKARAADERQAAVNRVAFGRTKGETATAQQEMGRREQMLDGARLSDPAPLPDRR